jgi:hypothetical protein
MNILSLGTPLFSSSWRAAGHRVLVLADGAQSSHEDNHAFDFFSHPDTCAERFGLIADQFQPDVIFQGDHSTPLIHCGLEDIGIPKAWYSIDSHLPLFDRVFVAQKSLVPHLSRYQPQACWLPPFCQQTAEFTTWAGREHDAAFVGTLDRARNPERVRLFDTLQQSGISIFLATGAYRPVYSSSRIVINQAVKDDLNLRVFGAAAVCLSPTGSPTRCTIFLTKAVTTLPMRRAMLPIALKKSPGLWSTRIRLRA